MSNEELYEMAASTTTRKEFLLFLKELMESYSKRQPGEWQNDDLESYLSGLFGFASDIEGYFTNWGEPVDTEMITWRMMAQMLCAAAKYE